MYSCTENKVNLTHGLLSISTGLWERTAADLPLNWTQAGVRRGAPVETQSCKGSEMQQGPDMFLISSTRISTLWLGTTFL